MTTLAHEIEAEINREFATVTVREPQPHPSDHGTMMLQKLIVTGPNGAGKSYPSWF
ncbi:MULTISPECIES: hypothetical protein [Rhizobium]|uniref:hypothetical protein n=1 Tax=Rhizobium TaxID=379 RepID=UPI0013EEEB41|nr:MULTISPECIES: hypothetical protein [Rhizobium]